MFWRRRRKGKGGEPRAEQGGAEAEAGGVHASPPAPRGEKRLVVVGSSKGGVGKSFVAANLAVVTAALSKSSVAAVDADLDNATLSERLPPHRFYRDVVRRLAASGETILSFADFLVEGTLPTGRIIPVIRGNTEACDGSRIEYRVRLIPAVDPVRRVELRAALQGLDSLMLRSGVQAMVEWLRQQGYLAIVDVKQKSNLGINYEPLYSALLEAADVFILVTEPPYIAFSDIVAPYTDHLYKTVIVVNKVMGEHVQKVAILVRDAKREGVPVHVLPYTEDDAEVYVRRLQVPAALSLRRRSALYTAALAARLGLVDGELLRRTGCAEKISTIVKLHEEV